MKSQLMLKNGKTTTAKKNKRKTIMEKDYNIKVDGEEAAFEGGAIRYKKSKGRFDLIPKDVERRFLKRLTDLIVENRTPFIPGDIVSTLNSLSSVDDADDENRFIDIIIRIMLHRYEGYSSHFVKYMHMMQELAIHFQKGAEKYGEHNCEKGIPLWSFIDSGTRHTLQYLLGEEDEPHYISAIWNFWMADWTIHKE